MPLGHPHQGVAFESTLLRSDRRLLSPCQPRVSGAAPPSACIDRGLEGLPPKPFGLTDCATELHRFQGLLCSPHRAQHSSRKPICVENSTGEASRQLWTDSEAAVEFLWKICLAKVQPPIPFSAHPPTHRAEAKHKNRREFKACQDPKLWELVSHILRKKRALTPKIFRLELRLHILYSAE